GVSIGAINATVLCGCRDGDPRAALTALWRDLTTASLPPPLDGANQRLSVFGNLGMYVPRTDYVNLWNWTSFYDTWPLAATLRRHVDFGKLCPRNFESGVAGRAPRLILTATNLSTGKLDKFDSAEMPITPAHVAASGSLPPSFPATLA